MKENIAKTKSLSKSCPQGTFNPRQYFQLRAVLDKLMTSTIQIQTILCSLQKLLAPTTKIELNTLNFSFDQFMHGQHPVVRSRSFHSNQHLPSHLSSSMTCSRSASFSGVQSSHLDAGVGTMPSVDGAQSVVYCNEHAVSSCSYWWELMVMRKIGEISLRCIWDFKKCTVNACLLRETAIGVPTAA